MDKLLKLTKVVQRSVSAHSPAILTGIAAAGVLTTAFLSTKATIKAVRKVDAANMKKYLEYDMTETIRAADGEAQLELLQKPDVKLTNAEIFQLVWMDYLPPLISAGGTIAALIGANQIASRRNAAAMSLYTMAEAAHDEYVKRLENKLTPEQKTEVESEIAQDTVDRIPMSSDQIFTTGDGRDLVLDPQSGRYFYSTQETVQRAVNAINREAQFEGTVSQNKFYKLLKLPMVGFADRVGWRDDHVLEIDFTTAIAEDGRPCLVMNYREDPHSGHWEPIIDGKIEYGKRSTNY